MKQYQRKGFTLVELLAVIVVLGIILLIAVSNVLGI
ncbi:MAG: prepilin-type N-terminal cleavage/methylation domain-containing protein, partial [Bacilli bacterium]|nr:prepilin-type N-terminal cleavage/methylation domain-containing protein [Bacilli bacterium]